MFANYFQCTYYNGKPNRDCVRAASGVLAARGESTLDPALLFHCVNAWTPPRNLYMPKKLKSWVGETHARCLIDIEIFTLLSLNSWRIDVLSERFLVPRLLDPPAYVSGPVCPPITSPSVASLVAIEVPTRHIPIQPSGTAFYSESSIERRSKNLCNCVIEISLYVY